MEAYQDITKRAYAAWDLRLFDEAAALFAEAANLERGAASKRNRWAAPDQSVLYEGRQGFCLWEGGRHEEARPLLEKLTRVDWEATRLWGDRRDAAKAYAYLLLDLAAASDRDAFVQVWREATEKCRVIQMEFPFAHPQQRMLIAACIEMNYPDGCRQILIGMDNEADKDPELHLAARRARRFLSNANNSR
jgi:tetratricopeptide (TPR) repeat protein